MIVATANVMIAEMRAAIFSNVAIASVIARPGKRPIRPPDPTVNNHVTKWTKREGVVQINIFSTRVYSVQSGLGPKP